MLSRVTDKFKQTLLLLSFLMLTNLTVSAEENRQACYHDCTNDYGNVLGKTKTGVTAYSNCNNECVIFEAASFDGIYTGVKWQCVEFARRWLLMNYGVVYKDVDYAIDIWGKIDHYLKIADKSQIPVRSYVNGSEQSPVPGDLLIYAKALLNTGHVAVVTNIDKQNNKLYIAEQNYSNKKWPGDYSRAVDYIIKDKRFWVLDEYLIGWKHAAFR
ncbi:MAG: CHAP domain-containing protein [Gammaproteobacteria bacterium]|nr:CHAP domain-containing protein [Gammaproteobacteria bacterium]